MPMQSLPLKYRPQVFSDLVGNSQITIILKATVKQNKIRTAYFMSGGRGSGKTTSARIFAKAINCLNSVEGEPCNACASCISFDNDASYDIMEIDAASENSVQSIKELTNSLQYAPTNSKYKVVILDECHLLSKAAANALLKTLEEPPAHVVFIFCTTDPQMVLDTIKSRCMQFSFKRLMSNEIVGRLKYICEMEKIEYELEALNLISFSVNGGMRDAITYLDQLSISTGRVTATDCAGLVGFITFSAMVELFGCIQDTEKSIRWARNKLQTNSPTEIINSVLRFIENVIYVQNNVAMTDMPKDIFDSIKILSTSLEFRHLVEFVATCNKVLLDIKRINVFDHSIFIFALLLNFKAILCGSGTAAQFSLSEAFRGISSQAAEKTQLELLKKYFSLEVLDGQPLYEAVK